MNKRYFKFWFIYCLYRVLGSLPTNQNLKVRWTPSPQKNSNYATKMTILRALAPAFTPRTTYISRKRVSWDQSGVTAVRRFKVIAEEQIVRGRKTAGTVLHSTQKHSPSKIRDAGGKEAVPFELPPSPTEEWELRRKNAFDNNCATRDIVATTLTNVLVDDGEPPLKKVKDEFTLLLEKSEFYEEGQKKEAMDKWFVEEIALGRLYREPVINDPFPSQEGKGCLRAWCE